MDWKIPKKLIGLVVPEGLLLVAAVVLLRTEALPLSAEVFAHRYGYLVFATGALLAWRFHRSRLLLALLVLALAHVAMRYFGANASLGTDGGAIVFHAVALLLPLNLAALTLMADRGILTRVGGLRVAVLLVQIGLVVLLVRPEPAWAAGLLEHGLVTAGMVAWSPVGQPALTAFAAVLALLAARLLWQPRPIDRGFLWAIVASFLALSADTAGAGPTVYLATAGLSLVVGEIESSHFMAYRDGLTGLPARRALNEALLRLGGQFTVAMVDVDRFKAFNDRYGHDVGDQVLRMVAGRLAEASGGGRAFRYGGEEFALLFPGKSADEVLPHLERLRRAVQERGFVLRGPDRPRRRPKNNKGGKKRPPKVSVTISIGAADHGDRRTTSDDVVKEADRALYRAKKGGRNRVTAASGAARG